MAQAHDVPARYHAQLRARQAEGDPDANVYRSRVGAHKRELDPLVRLLVWVLGRSTLKQLGYT